MSNSLILTVLASLCLASAARTIDGRNFRGKAVVTSKGPHMIIRLSWKDRLECRYGMKPLYEIVYYDAQDAATTIERKYPNKTLTIESPLEELGPLNILFWNKNKIQVLADCPMRHEVERFVLNDMPGELLPVESIDFEPQQTGGVVTWTLSKLQNAATHVLVKTCPSWEDENCTHETALPIKQMNYTVEDLRPGIRRTVFVRLENRQRRGGSYYSDFMKKTIEALPPPEDAFPPIENLAVEVVRHGNDDSDVNISYSKPENIPSGLVWWGIEARIVDTVGNIVLKDFRTQDLNFMKTELNLFNDMTVGVRAIYISNDDQVLSKERTCDFYTGIGHLAKPEFRVDAIDDTKALVRWTHAPKDSFETNFTISWDGGNQMEVLMSKKTYAVIDGLISGQKYDVNITAHIVHESRRFENTSDTKPVTILPKDALKPRASCKKVAPEGMEITWEVVMPDDPKYCRFAVRVCPERVSAHCLQRFPLFNELRTARVDFFPFENQTVEVVNTCNYYHDVIVTKVSDPLLTFGAFKLSAVKNLSVNPLSETTVKIDFEQIEEEARFVEGYKVRWSLQGTNSSQTKDYKTNGTGLVLSSLEPTSTYDISVAPFTSEENQGLIGFESQAKVLTLLPAPPKVTDLSAKQSSMSYHVFLVWNMPQYAFDIFYEIDATCGAWTQNYTTDSTNFNVTVTADHGENCTFAVKAATNVSSQPKRTAEAMKTVITFEGLEPPQEIRMKGCAVKFKYDLEIVPPESAKSLEIRYQFAEISKPYKYLLEDNSISYTAYRSGVPIEVKARICYEGVCSSDKNLKFMTNSDAPGAVDSMNMTIRENTNILMQWNKPSITLGPIDGYLINIRDEETKIITIVELPGNETSYTFESDKEHVEYRIEYFAFNKDRCVPGRFLGAVSTRNFLTSGEKFPPPKEFHTGSFGSQQGIYWDPPEGIEVKKYHIVGTPSVRREYALGNDAEVVNRFTSEPGIPFSCFKPYTKYSIEISSCTTVEVKSCGRSFHYETETEVGHPGRPSARVAEEGVNTISVIMTPPEDRAGPIDGYRVAFLDRSKGESPTNWEEYHKDLHFAVLRNLTEGTAYVIHIQAFNLNSDHEPLFSPVAILNAETRGDVGSASAATVALSVFVVAVILAVIGAVGYRVLRRPKSDDTQRLTVPVIDLQGVPASATGE